MTWLVAIGLTNAVLAGGLAALAWGVGRYARRPALARLLWILVLCKLLAPPVYRPALGNWSHLPAWLTPATTVAEPAPEGFAAPRPATPASRSSSFDRTATAGHSAATPTGTRPGLVLAGWRATGLGGNWTVSSSIELAADLWLTGSVLSLAWLAYRTWRFRRFLSLAARDNSALTERVVHLARSAGLSSSPRVLVVESAVSPMLWGAGRGACLLFPAELVERVDAAACDTLLLHELAHYARGDWLVRVLELSAQVVYWWHPLVWWTLRNIEAAEEECCDAWVVKHQAGDRRLYAEALLATLDFLCEPLGALPPAACGLGDAGSLRSRLTQIMCGEVALRPSRAARSMVLLIAAVALPIGPSIAGSRPRTAAALGTTHQLAPLAGAAPTARLSGPERSADPRSGQSVLRGDAGAAASAPRPWFVPRAPAPTAVPALYATAISPNGRYQLEARTGHRAALVNVAANKRLDLSAYCILAASFSADSRLLATGQKDESAVRLWDAETGEVRALFKGSAAGITTVAFAPDASRLAAGAADGSVLIWNVTEEEVVARLPRQQAPVTCVRWSTSGDRLAITRGDWSDRGSSSLAVWQPSEEEGVKELSLDDSAGALDWLGEEELVVADWSGAARVIDLNSLLPVESFWLGKDAVSAASFSPDCRLVPPWQAMGDVKP